MSLVTDVKKQQHCLYVFLERHFLGNNFLMLLPKMQLKVFFFFCSFIICVYQKTWVRITWFWWTAPCPPELLPWWLYGCCWWVLSTKFWINTVLCSIKFSVCFLFVILNHISFFFFLHNCIYFGFSQILSSICPACCHQRDFLCQDHDVQEDKILLVSLLMAEMGVHSVAYAFPQVKIITTAVDKKVNDVFHIIPGIGE